MREPLQGDHELALRPVSLLPESVVGKATRGNRQGRSVLEERPGPAVRSSKGEATTRIDRHDFSVSWQHDIPAGVVVSNEIDLVLDADAILLEDLERTGAIGYYRTHAEAT